MSRDNLPGWTVIRTREDLLEHDPADPAYVLVPPGLVPIVGDWLIARSEPGPKGERYRLFEERLLQLAADPIVDAPIAGPLGDEAHHETGSDGLPAGDDADDGQLAELAHEPPLSEEVDVDDEETFLEGEREEPRVDGQGAEGDSAADLEELWHDFSDELSGAEFVDSEPQVDTAAERPWRKEQGHGIDT